MRRLSGLSHTSAGCGIRVKYSSGMVISKESYINLENTLLQCHFVSLEAHMKLPGIEPGALS